MHSSASHFERLALPSAQFPPRLAPRDSPDRSHAGKLRCAMTDQDQYTAHVDHRDGKVSTRYDAPVGWGPDEVRKALQDLGFRPDDRGDHPDRVSVGITTTGKIVLGAEHNFPHVSGFSPGPSEYYLPEATEVETEQALVAAGFVYATRAVMQHPPSPSWPAPSWPVTPGPAAAGGRTPRDPGSPRRRGAAPIQ